MQQSEILIFSIMTIPTDLAVRYLNSYKDIKNEASLMSHK